MGHRRRKNSSSTTTEDNYYVPMSYQNRKTHKKMSRNGILKSSGRKNSPAPKLRDPVEVFCRVRPLPDEEDESCIEHLDQNVVQLNAPKNLKNSSKVEKLKCTFSRVFPEVISQCELFQNVGLPLVRDLLSGKNGLCFMYGITGSGKTHTMNGTPNNGGILPRCLDVLFNSIAGLQTQRCVFKPDGYNGFDLYNNDEMYTESRRKSLELQASLALKTKQRNKDLPDLTRIPDSTQLEVDEDNNYAVFVSYVEIYNNTIFDLLEDAPIDPYKQKQPTSKILREDPRRNMFVYEVIEVEVKSTEEAFDLFWRGQNRRKTAHTVLNTESSRSHSVFSIRLVQAPLGPDGTGILNSSEAVGISQLCLCDLAGSERTSRTKAGGDRIREAGNINNSLMTLRSCIEVLRENQKTQDTGGLSKMVPFRDSKLTHLFKNYFDGDGKVQMLVCLNPCAGDFDESLHVMRFAEVTQEVKVARSDGVKFDLGLTPGRRNAAKAFREVVKDMEDGIISSSSDSQEELMKPLQNFAPWTILELSSCYDNTTLSSLILYLEERIRLRKTLLVDWNQKQMEVRNLILQLEQDNVDLTKAIEEQRGTLNEKEKECKNYEKRIKQINEKLENLTRSNHTFEMQKRQAEQDLERHRDLYAKERQEKLKLKQTLRDHAVTEKERMDKECAKQVRQTKLEMEGHILSKSEKLKQLRDVVQNLELPKENQLRLNRIMSGEYKENRVRTSHYVAEEKLSKTPRPPKVAAKPPSSRGRTKTENTRSRSPPPAISTAKVSKTMTPSNNALNSDRQTPVRAKHRRSRSSDYWLEHKPQTTLTTDTVMQPQIPKKRTVNMPKVKDFRKVFGMDATPNYILTHQEEDSCGEIETKLIKGEVLKTRGGGTSVQFTDVETLKKTTEAKQCKAEVVAQTAEKIVASSLQTPSGTPGKVKRNGDKRKKRKSQGEEAANNDDSWTDVETRCAVGIEGKPGCEPGLMHHAKKAKN